MNKNFPGTCSLAAAWLAAALLAGAAFAQAPAGKNAVAPKPAAPGAAEERHATMVKEWQRARLGTQDYIDAMPEEAIHFRPTPEVRTFAEQYLHIAAGNYMFASAAAGLENPYDFTRGRDPEKMEEFKTSKAALRKFVLESYDFMIRAVEGLEAAKLDEDAQFFNLKMPRYLLLTKAIEHHAHHRGQTTVYLRLNGITPPSERLF